MPGPRTTSFDAWIGRTTLTTSFDALLQMRRGAVTSFDAVLGHYTETSFDALLVDERGTFRGVGPSLDRDALEALQPGDTFLVTDP